MLIIRITIRIVSFSDVYMYIYRKFRLHYGYVLRVPVWLWCFIHFVEYIHFIFIYIYIGYCCSYDDAWNFKCISYFGRVNSLFVCRNFYLALATGKGIALSFVIARQAVAVCPHLSQASKVPELVVCCMTCSCRRNMYIYTKDDGFFRHASHVRSCRWKSQ